MLQVIWDQVEHAAAPYNHHQPFRFSKFQKNPRSFTLRKSDLNDFTMGKKMRSTKRHGDRHLLWSVSLSYYYSMFCAALLLNHHPKYHRVLAFTKTATNKQTIPFDRQFKMATMSSAATSSNNKSSSSSSSSEKSLVIEPFCYRQFAENEESKSYLGTVFQLSMSEFEDIVNQRFQDNLLKDGYAPFCKHLFVENDFTNATPNVLKITPENEHLLRTEYQARNDKELPVLTRYFPSSSVDSSSSSSSSIDIPKAKYLDLILYSREQIIKEDEAQGRTRQQTAAPWGIVSIKAQDVNFELPMTPITAMRNALGKEEGGSGVALNRQEYLKAVAYWKDHATVS